MPVIVPITTHEADQLDRLLSQLKNKPLIEAILNAIGEQAQDFEDAVTGMNALLDISTQVGVQLDGIGGMVGEARQGKTDADYRQALQARIAAIYASGTGEDMIAAFVIATGATDVTVLAAYPAGVRLVGNGTAPSNLLQLMQAAAPAGVQVGLSSNLVWEDGDNAVWENGNNAVVVPQS